MVLVYHGARREHRESGKSFTIFFRHLGALRDLGGKQIQKINRKMAKMASAILVIAIVLATAPAYAQIPIPHGISGIVYMSDGVTQAPWGTNFSVNDTVSGDYIEGTTGAGPNSGWYSVSINGTDGDLVIIKAWNATHYGERTVVLEGDMTGIDVIINKTLVDTIPPAGVSNLDEIDRGTTWILWNWTNPLDPDFNYTEVYVEGVFKANIYAPDHIYNATGLSPDTTYEIGTRTLDDSGNINTTWVNDTATTTPTPTPVPVFDTGSPSNPYSSIFGTHNGTIKPNQTITVHKLYTYPCAGTGGHTEYARIWNSTLDVNATWNGYKGDWHNLSFPEPFKLYANEAYNYTIRTGSYPQIIHEQNYTTLDGSFINCTSFVDANGKKYNDWIPAIRLFLQ